MRTSNKILLGTFLAAVLIITGIHVALYAKLKSGDLVVFRKAAPAPSLERHETPNVKHVLVIGMEECRVINSDTAHIELSKNWKEHLEWRINGDSLVIRGPGSRNNEMGVRVYAPVELHLPEDVVLHARHSNLYLRGASDSTKAFSRSVNADQCGTFVVVNVRGDNRAYWKKLTITSRQGAVNIAPATEIQDMELVLNDASAFTDEGAGFGSISVSVDSTSTISLRSRSLENLKIIKP